MLGEFHALPQLARHDEWGYHLHATSPQQPLAERMAVEAAMAFVDVVRQQELDRVHVCDPDASPAVLVALKKTRSRRYCTPPCSTRVNVAASRARRSGG